jgi:hypothetical protein
MTAVTPRLDDAGWLELPSHTDERGTLTVVESGQDISFEVKRIYVLHHMVGARGGHAHRDTHQVVVALAGALTLRLCDGVERRTFRLDDPTRGVYFGPMLFIEIDDFTTDAAALVFASTHYDKARSIRSWEEYLKERGL